MTFTFSFDGTSSSSITGLSVIDVRRPLRGTVRDVYVEIPGRDGSWLFTDNPGDREITVKCALVCGSQSTLRSSVSSLASMLTLTGRRQLIFSDQSDRFWLARLVDFGDIEETIGTGFVDLTFRCDPYAYSTSASTQTLGPTSTEPYSTTFSVTTAADTPFTCEITPSGAALTSGFVLTVNGDALTYGSTLADGSTLIISSVANTVTLSPSTLDMSTVSGTFGKLINGTNSITFDRASGTASTTLVFTWRRRYL